jgi:pimeloyl-ACP methyl ester carboxylesterase
MSGRAFFREAGSGPAVVCIHSSASSSAQWRPLMDRVAGRYRALAVDLYGSGKSPEWPAGRPLSLADEVALLGSVLVAAGERFHLVGHSYGGAVALAAALAAPDRVASLVLFEPVLFSVLIAEDPTHPAAREITAVRDDTVAALERGDPRASGARFVDYWMGGGTWAAMPEPRREALAIAMSAVRAEWDAAFREPTPLSRLVQGSGPPAHEDLAARDRGRDRRRGAHGPGDPSRSGQRAHRALSHQRSDYTNRIDEEESTWQVRPRPASSRKRC